MKYFRFDLLLLIVMLANLFPARSLGTESNTAEPIESRYLKTDSDLSSGRHHHIESSLLPPSYHQYVIPEKHGFLSPNEHVPQGLKVGLDQAPRGAYVSVGTERGFIGASLAPNSTHLILTDVDDSVVLFNRVNAALLKIAEDHEEYLRLRFAKGKAGRKLWRDAIERTMIFDSATVRMMLDKKVFGFWESALSHPQFRYFHDKTPICPNLGFSEYFKDSNYLFDKNLFSRVQKLAKENRIWSLKLDYNDIQSVQRMTEIIQSRGVTVSVLDLSNAWWRTYIRRPNLKSVIHYFLKLIHKNSWLILTRQNKIQEYNLTEFTYYFYHLDQISGEHFDPFSEYIDIHKNTGTIENLENSTQFDPHLN